MPTSEMTLSPPSVMEAAWTSCPLCQIATSAVPPTKIDEHDAHLTLFTVEHCSTGCERIQRNPGDVEAGLLAALDQVAERSGGRGNHMRAGLQATTEHALRVPDSFVMVDDEVAHQRVQEHLPRRRTGQLRGMQARGRRRRSRHLLALDVDHPVTVHPVDMSAADADDHIGDLAARHQLGFFDRPNGCTPRSSRYRRPAPSAARSTRADRCLRRRRRCGPPCRSAHRPSMFRRLRRRCARCLCASLYLHTGCPRSVTLISYAYCHPVIRGPIEHHVVGGLFVFIQDVVDLDEPVNSPIQVTGSEADLGAVIEDQRVSEHRGRTGPLARLHAFPIGECSVELQQLERTCRCFAVHDDAAVVYDGHTDQDRECPPVPSPTDHGSTAL